MGRVELLILIESVHLVGEEEEEEELAGYGQTETLPGWLIANWHKTNSMEVGWVSSETFSIERM